MATQAEQRDKDRDKKIGAELSRLKAAGVKFQGSNDFVSQLLDQADELATEKEGLFERIGSNRTLLREVMTTGLLSEAQAKEILAIYPPTERGRGRKPKGEGDNS